MHSSPRQNAIYELSQDGSSVPEAQTVDSGEQIKAETHVSSGLDGNSGQIML